jgi:hypothetical protein
MGKGKGKGKRERDRIGDWEGKGAGERERYGLHAVVQALFLSFGTLPHVLLACKF